jgi:sterol desaturase/sphingolipid hydroxylase (fatty acid hydroxylase superfamily)
MAREKERIWLQCSAIDVIGSKGQVINIEGGSLGLGRRTKTLVGFAVAPALVLAIFLFAWCEIYTASGQPTAIFDSLRNYFSKALSVIDSIRMGRVGVLVIFVLLAETFFVGWRGSSVFRLVIDRRTSAIVDLLYFLCTLLNLTFFFEIAFTLGASLVASQFIDWVSSNYGWRRMTLPSDGIFEVSVGFAIYWLASSFMQYWGHRLMHTPIFWPLHRFHHAATELNMITVFRVHPLEPLLLRPLTLVSPLIFFNVPQQILVLYFCLATVSDLLAHSQLPWTYGWMGRWLVQSPRVHQVHHSKEDEHRDLHFSNCPLWDHMFGTWYKGTKLPTQFGIPDPAHEVRPLTQFVLDAGMFYANLARWVVCAAAAVQGFARRFAPSPLNGRHARSSAATDPPQLG